MCVNVSTRRGSRSKIHSPNKESMRWEKPSGKNPISQEKSFGLRNGHCRAFFHAKGRPPAVHCIDDVATTEKHFVTCVELVAPTVEFRNDSVGPSHNSLSEWNPCINMPSILIAEFSSNCESLNLHFHRTHSGILQSLTEEVAPCSPRRGWARRAGGKILIMKCDEQW